MDEKLLQRPYNGHEFSKQEQGNLLGTGNLGGIIPIKNPKHGEQILVFVSRDRKPLLKPGNPSRWKTCNSKTGRNAVPIFKSVQRSVVWSSCRGLPSSSCSRGSSPHSSRLQD